MRRTRATRQTPKVTVNCVADAYSQPNTRTVEFTFPGTGNGGLIRFWVATNPDGTVEDRVLLYRVAGGVRILTEHQA